jgi:hypothetical protein
LRAASQRKLFRELDELERRADERERVADERDRVADEREEARLADGRAPGSGSVLNRSQEARPTAEE